MSIKLVDSNYSYWWIFQRKNEKEIKKGLSDVISVLSIYINFLNIPKDTTLININCYPWAELHLNGLGFIWTSAASLLLSISLNPETLLPTWRMRILRCMQPGERLRGAEE
jgi:hypothetical protein